MPAAPVVADEIDRFVEDLQLRLEPVPVGQLRGREVGRQRGAEAGWRKQHHVVATEFCDQRAPDRRRLRIAVHEHHCHGAIVTYGFCVAVSADSGVVVGWLVIAGWFVGVEEFFGVV